MRLIFIWTSILLVLFAILDFLSDLFIRPDSPSAATGWDKTAGVALFAWIVAAFLYWSDEE